MYISHNDIIVPNNGYVASSDIGSWYNSPLICHTNRPASRGNSGGDWYNPEGERIGEASTVQGLASLRDRMHVRLYRTGFALPPEGIYHCEIRDILNIKHQIYVGIYSSRSGQLYNVAKHCIYFCKTIHFRIFQNKECNVHPSLQSK